MGPISKEKKENIHLRTGYSCSNSCMFCMESDKAGRYREVRRFIDSGGIYRMMDENVGVRKVIFTQGEPTLNPDLPKYVAYAKRLGYPEIAIISNGRRYADLEFCAELIRSGVTEFIISVHGHRKEIHETLTRGAGSFGQVSEGLKNLSRLKRKHPVHIVVSHVVNRLNYPFIGDFLRFMEKNDVDEVVLNVVQPLGGNMEKLFSALMPSYSELAKVLERELDQIDRSFLDSDPRRRTHRRHISVIDLPLCLSEKLLSHMGFGETRILDDEGRTVRITNVPYKSKGPQCHECAHFDVCEGVYDRYIEHFGWDEFVPVKR